MVPDEARLMELLDLLETTLLEVRDILERGRLQADTGPAKAVQAFADEAFRDRDA